MNGSICCSFFCIHFAAATNVAATDTMTTDVTLLDISDLLENFAKNVYRAKNSDQGSPVSIQVASLAIYNGLIDILVYK